MRIPTALLLCSLVVSCSGDYPSGKRTTFGGPVPHEERCLVGWEADVDREIRCGRFEERDREAWVKHAALLTDGGPCVPTPEQEKLLAAGTVRSTVVSTDAPTGPAPTPTPSAGDPE